MAYYRLYFFDRGGHIDQFREFEAPDDALAVAEAADWRELDAMELWCGRRMVRRWEAFALAPETRARSAVSALRAEAGPEPVEGRGILFAFLQAPFCGLDS